MIRLTKNFRPPLRLSRRVRRSSFSLVAAAPRPSAQDETSRFRVNVVLVQLNVAVTDSKGNYVTGLRPEDFAITEDNIPAKDRHLRRRQQRIRPHETTPQSQPR